MVQNMIMEKKESVIKIDAQGIQTRELNTLLRNAVSDGADKIELINICGQRYIGTDLDKNIEIDVYGTPGNNLGSFMNGPRIIVHGNAQDGCGNTMNEGEIIVHGHAGDIVGLSARGGRIFIKDSVGYRAGIHMKEFGDKKPVIVIGQTAQDFLGEYMAGGIIVLLGMGMGENRQYSADYIGTGMHGGVIYLRGQVEDSQLGKEVGVADIDDTDYIILTGLVNEFAANFGYDTAKILQSNFIKLFPLHLRPYGRLYAY